MSKANVCVVVIDTGNAAFEERGELSSILEQAKRKITPTPPMDVKLMDSNGNTVGFVMCGNSDVVLAELLNRWIDI